MLGVILGIDVIRLTILTRTWHIVMVPAGNAGVPSRHEHVNATIYNPAFSPLAARIKKGVGYWTA